MNATGRNYSNIPEGQKTKIILARIIEGGKFDFSYASEIADLNFIDHFCDALHDALVVTNKIEETDNEDLMKILLNNVKLIYDNDKHHDTNLRNWLNPNRKTRQLPRHDSRDTIYHICLGLGLTVEQTEEFFLKGCMFPPFDPKRKNDVIYYYCISNNKTVDEARDLIQEHKSCSPSTSSENTTGLFGAMKKLNNKNALESYIKEHCREGSRTFSSAMEIISELEKSQRYRLTGTDNKIIGKDDISASAFKKRWDGRDNSPALKDEFPSNETLNIYRALINVAQKMPVYTSDQIVKIRKGDPELIRRTLIALLFNQYFIDHLHQNVLTAESRLEDFCVWLDNELDSYGFMQIYPRNPFDFIILTCASRCAYFEDDEAVQALREVVDNLIWAKGSLYDDGGLNEYNS